MIKIAGLVKRADGVSRESFREEYEKRYVSLAVSLLPQLKRYTRNYVVESRSPAGWEPNFDVVTHMWFEDRSALDEALTVLVSAKAAQVMEGEPVFMDGSSPRSVIVKERESKIPPSSAPVDWKGMVLVSRRSSLTVEQFKEQYEKGHAVLIQTMMAPHLLSYVRNYVVDSATPGWRPDFDGITEFSYDGEDRELSDEDRQNIVRDEESLLDRSSMRSFTVQEEESELL